MSPTDPIDFIDTFEDEPVEIPIDGTLDLHTFSPREVKDLVPDYLEACREKRIFEVFIIHGKGKGVLQKTVHAILERLSYVESFDTDRERGGNWGRTMARLRPLPDPED